MHEDFERCLRALRSRDARFDGWFVTAVTSTGIFCRPSCPARTPRREHLRFLPSAACAQQEGFRACLRCRPDAAPGSPEWAGRADLAARAVRLILDGAVDREGVSGLAARLGYSERQLHRVLVAEVGTGALALARAQRAQTARVLLESTTLPAVEVAFAAGFASLRQFNDTVRQIFARSPTELRRRAPTPLSARRPSPPISLRLPHRRPLAARSLLAFLGARAVPGLEAAEGGRYRRSLRLERGSATVEIVLERTGDLHAVFVLEDLRDLTAAVARVRRLLDLDADPVAVDETLAADRLLGPMVRRVPGLRVPGSVDGFELAVRAVVGQAVSVRAARAITTRLVQAAGEPLALSQPAGGLTHAFPTPEAIAELCATPTAALGMPAARREALLGLARAVAGERVVLDPGADRSELRAGLLSLPGIGPWTADYVAMRGAGDPDAFLPTDLLVRRTLGPQAEHRAGSWRPWRAYAVNHLWNDAARAAEERSAA